jgi:hypothetical protein
MVFPSLITDACLSGGLPLRTFSICNTVAFELLQCARLDNEGLRVLRWMLRLLQFTRAGCPSRRSAAVAAGDRPQNLVLTAGAVTLYLVRQ